MKWGFTFLAIALFLCINSAFSPVKAGEIVNEPLCFTLINSAEHKVYGSFRTDLYTRPDGIQARHTSNFRLEPMDTLHEEEGYPIDRAEFCSYGPFYEGRKIELVLRTLVPIFSCKTNIESGPIIIKSLPKTDDAMGGYDVWAECFD